MTSVVLAGRDPAQTTASRRALRASGGWQVLGPAHTAAAARLLLQQHDPDLLVCDLRLAEGSAIDLLRVLRNDHARTRMLIVAPDPTDPLLLDALQEGADNFHPSDGAAPGALAVRARATLAGSADIAPGIASRLLEHFDADLAAGERLSIAQLSSPLTLTAAERRLLRQLALGLRLADMARAEGVAAAELCNRVRGIHRKMQWNLRAGDLSL